MSGKYSAEWFEDVLNAMQELVLVKGPNSNLLWANNSFLSYYGMSQDQLFEIVDAQHSDPDDTLQYVKDDLTVVETAAALDVPREAVTDASGASRYFHTVKSPICEDGAVTKTVGVSRLLEDTTIAKREIDHKDAKAFVAPIRAISESFPNPMLMVDSRMRIISASPLWKEYFGDPEIKPDSFFYNLHSDLSELCIDLKDCLAQEKTTESTVRNAGPDGEARVFSVRTSPWTYRNGSIGGATIIATNVSEIHKQAEELDNANEELMQFSYRASHDLRGPLSTAKGLAKFIAMDIADGDVDAAIANASKIETMMEKLEKTVVSFLTLASVDNLNPQGEVIDLLEIVNDICTGLDRQLTSSDIVVETDLNVLHFQGQNVRIRQVLENLISNAIKYHDPKKMDKRVRVSSCFDKQGAIKLIVEDNGCGIPEHAVSKIFDSFSRFHEGSEGTGLGLAIVKKHIVSMAGQISVERSGLGTSFLVTLPAIALELAS